MSNDTKVITDASFEADVLKSEKPVLVDFWAVWCGPCKMLSPLIDAVASEYAGKLVVAKMNVDENPQTPQKFGLRGIPALLLFKNGELTAQKVGAMSRTQLKAFIDANV